MTGSGRPYDAKSSIEIVWDAEAPEPIEILETSYELLAESDVEHEVLGTPETTAERILRQGTIKGIAKFEEDENDREAR